MRREEKEFMVVVKSRRKRPELKPSGVRKTDAKSMQQLQGITHQALSESRVEPREVKVSRGWRSKLIVEGEPVDSAGRLMDRISQSLRLVEESALLRVLLEIQVRPTLTECVDIVCYGVGNFALHTDARSQLALAVLLFRHLQMTGKLYIYDPAFSEDERAALVELGCTLIETDEEGKRTVTTPTLFVMPHCDLWLYVNVLRANEASRRQLLVLGNSFASYVERSLNKEDPLIAYLSQVPHEEFGVPDSAFPGSGAFHQTNLHMFS